MRVSCLQENLAWGLGIVGRAVSHRSTLPVLGNIMLQTDKGQLRLSATNLEIGIHCWVRAKVEEEGATTVPARLLADFVNTLPPAQIDLDLSIRTQSLNLQCQRYEANIKGIDASEFPMIPRAGVEGIVSLEPKLLREMIEQVAFAAATDESRPTLAGVHASFSGDSFVMAATDGYRLSVRKTQLSEPVSEPVSVIVPARSMTELGRIVGQLPQEVEGEQTRIAVSVTPAANQILFHMPGVDLVSQIIEGTFPDYSAIIPTTSETRTTLQTEAFLKAVRVAALFARDGSNIVRLQVEPGDSGADATKGSATVTATSSELGNNVTALDAIVEGGGIDIAFSARYLADVLDVIGSDHVVLDTISPTSPGVMRPIGVGAETFTHVIMPMRPH